MRNEEVGYCVLSRGRGIFCYINIQCCVSQTQKNFIMFILLLGQHVTILTESSSGPSKKINPYLKCLKMRCGIPNTYIRDKTSLVV